MLPNMKKELEKESDLVVNNGLPYLDTFQALDKVVESCFGTVLLPEYEENVESFLAPPLEELSICNSHSLTDSLTDSLPQIFALAETVKLSIISDDESCHRLMPG